MNKQELLDLNQIHDETGILVVTLQSDIRNSKVKKSIRRFSSSVYYIKTTNGYNARHYKHIVGGVMSKSLLARFKEIYEKGTGLKVTRSNLDKNGNLTVGIVNSEGKELFYLNVREYPNGEIYWF